MDKVLLIASVASALICMILLAIFAIWLLKSYQNRTLGMNRQSAANAALFFLDDIIRTSVVTTNQTLVESLKRERNFLQLDHEEAFEQCRSRIYNIVRPNHLKLLQPYMLDVDEWVNARIEYYVRLQK